MISYEFEVIGDITGKERPRVNTYTLRVYTPNKTKDYETLIQQYFKIKYPSSQVLEGRIEINITAYFKIPNNTSKKMEEQMLENNLSPTKKPDVDNIAKVVLDALNKVVFKDDNQVSKIFVEKKYDTEERLHIEVKEY